MVNFSISSTVPIFKTLINILKQYYGDKTTLEDNNWVNIRA